ncbi:MAG: hypothetical protein MZV70_71355 [Desulfobacterales bacterium]|nr:hypothetical protein [Desulfobacterales bacterium]
MSGSLRSIVLRGRALHRLQPAADRGLERPAALPGTQRPARSPAQHPGGGRPDPGGAGGCPPRTSKPSIPGTFGRCGSTPSVGSCPSAEGAGSALPFYLVVQEGDRPEGYIVPIDAKGLWGPINAYLAFGSDGATVKGFTVYRACRNPRPGR